MDDVVREIKGEIDEVIIKNIDILLPMFDILHRQVHYNMRKKCSICKICVTVNDCGVCLNCPTPSNCNICHQRYVKLNR